MCVAVIKPVGADLPTQKELYNCFQNNPNGAGYMYLDNGKLHIKKGFSTFKSFYEAFCNENFSKEVPIFIHFRIATHGLVDGGNTHPFPITCDIDKLRNTDFIFDGYGLMHNGIFNYTDQIYNYFDENHVISDTMLFDMLISYYLQHKDQLEQDKNDFFVEEAIAYSLAFNNKDFFDYIENSIGYNKVAIMDVNGNIYKFGDWKSHNGCFYSNSDYEDKSYFGFGSCFNNIEPNYYCDVCGEKTDVKNLECTTFGYVCKECLKSLPVFQCEYCGCYDLIKDKQGDSNLCCVCYQESKKNNYCCDICGKKSKNYVLTKDNKLICKDCYNKTDGNI